MNEVRHEVGDLVRFCAGFEDEKEWVEEGHGKMHMAKVVELHEDGRIELDFMFADGGVFECGEIWEPWMFEKIESLVC